MTTSDAPRRAIGLLSAVALLAASCATSLCAQVVAVGAPNGTANATALGLEARRHIAARHLDSALVTYRQLADVQHALGDRAGEGTSLHNIGVLFGMSQQGDSAITYLRSAVAVRRAAGEPKNLATTLQQLAIMFEKLGRRDSALAYYRAAAPLERAAADRAAEAVSLHQIGVLLEGAGQHDSALVPLRQAAALRHGTGDGAGEAASLMVLGVVFSTLDQRDSALVAYRSALPLYRATGNHDGEATVLHNTGVVFTDNAQPDSALPAFRDALAARRAAHDRIGEAKTLQELATAFNAAGQRDSAIAYFELSLPILASLNDRAGAAMSLQQLGTLSHAAGRYQLALDAFRGALQLRRSINDRSGEAKTLGSLGIVFNALGQRDSALASYRSELAINSAARDSEGVAASLHNLGVVMANLGQPDSALVYFRRSMALERARGDRKSIASTLSSIASVFDAQAMRDSALAYYRAALPLRRASGDRFGEAVTLNNAAGVYLVLEQLDSAMANFRAARALQRASGDRRGEAGTLGNIGAVFYRRGALDSARVYFALALDVARVVGDRPVEATSQNSLGDVLDRLGQRDASLAAYREAARVRSALDASVDQDFLRSSAREVTLPLLPMNHAIAALRATRPDTLEAWGALELGRSRSLLALRLGRSSPLDSTAVRTLGPATATLVASLARPGRAIVSFSRAGDSLLVLVIASDGRRGATLVRAPEAQLDTLLRATRASLGTAGTRGAPGGANVPVLTRAGSAAAEAFAFELRPTAGADTAYSTRLAAILLPQSVRALLASGTNELVIIPDGQLGVVPWAALPLDSAGTPLGARVAIRITPSLALLADAERASAQRGPVTRESLSANALVVGDPSLPPGVDGLPAARAEAHWVADTLLHVAGGALVGDSATISAVGLRLERASIAHFATHARAFADPRHARGAYLQLAASGTTESGILTVGALLDAAETNKLRLQARLIVLSACETGVGAPSQSEGLLGLPRAFLALGAEGLLVSLWKVDDAATRALIQAFYTHWLTAPVRAPSAAEALRRAQADMRVGRVPGWKPAWAKPAAWAAFQLVGAG